MKMVKKIIPKLTKEEKKRKEARRNSIGEGIFSSAKTAFGDHYISPFAIAINTSSSMLAMLSSMAGLLGPISQMFSSSKLMETYSRKKIVLKSVFWGSIIWLAFITIAILFYLEIWQSVLPFILLITFSVYIIISNIPIPPWFSWMGDLVEEEHRGRFFSKRGLILSFVAVVIAISSSFFLESLRDKNLIMIGFTTLFFLAFISKFTSWKILKKQYEPKLKLKKGHYFSFWDFLTESKKTNFGKFAQYRFFLTFATSISSPLLAVYLLRNLNFGYSTYMIIILSGTIFSLLVLELWGKIADKYGNYRVLGITSLMIPLIPILWIFNPSPIYLIFVPQLIGGISWAGFNLSAGNFIYDNVSPQKRGFASSYYNMMLGFGIFLGAGLGALLIKFLTIEIIEPIAAIFLISTVARIIAVTIWLPKLKEIRKTKKFRGMRTLKEIIFKEAKPTLLEEFHEIIHIKKYIISK